MSRRIAVVGGGPAGLATWQRLRDTGHEVQLFDPEPGGLMRTIRHDGWIIEAGAHTMATTDAGVGAMLRALDTDPEESSVAPRTRGRQVLLHGRPTPVPLSPGELVASPLLSMRGRLRLLREPFISAKPGGDDESVQDFARRRFGHEVAARIIDPIVGSSTGGDPRQLLARVLFPQHVQFEAAGGSVLRGAMRAGMQARRRKGGSSMPLSSHTNGIDWFVRAVLRQGNGSVCREAVTGITFSDVDVTVQWGDGSERFGGVVLAVPPAAMRAIRVVGVDAGQFEKVATMPCASVASVSLGYRREHVTRPLTGGSLLVPSSEHLPLLATFSADAMFPGRAPEGHLLITSIVGGVRHPDAFRDDDRTLTQQVHAALAGAMGLVAPPAMVHVTRWEGAMPQPVAGHFVRLAAADALEAGAPRLAFAGGWRGGMSIGEAMASGLRAANRLGGTMPA
ncbi:MAG: protoporphyrinogen oxidase [Gemmatimonadales bacterium]|nr:protoporphyrinogen oxidase [Gemmatimonadales bacterium]